MYKVPYTIWVFFTYQASYIYGSILCIAPPILHKMVPIYIVSYVLLWVHLMYNDSCGVLLLYIRWSLYIERVIRTIMGPSYVHRLLWGLTPVHKIVPIYIQCHTYYYGSILMYTDYCWVLLLYISTSYIGRNIANQDSLSYHSSDSAKPCISF